MAVTREIEAGQIFDLSTEVVGLARGTGRACFVEQVRNRPPRRIDGYTVGAPIITGDAPHNGELHPDADELLYLISGRVKVHLELADGERIIDVEGGQGIVVPRGVWHRIEMQEPGQLIHITPGPGGDHRPLTSPG